MVDRNLLGKRAPCWAEPRRRGAGKTCSRARRYAMSFEARPWKTEAEFNAGRGTQRIRKRLYQPKVRPPTAVTALTRAPSAGRNTDRGPCLASGIHTPVVRYLHVSDRVEFWVNHGKRLNGQRVHSPGVRVAKKKRRGRGAHLGHNSRALTAL